MNETPKVPDDPIHDRTTVPQGEPSCGTPQSADPWSTVDHDCSAPNLPDEISVGDNAKNLVDEVHMAGGMANEQVRQVQTDLIVGFEPGDVLAKRFKILGELGRGGMGVVYSAIDLKLTKPVAVKVAFWARVDWDGIKRLVKEAQKTAPLDQRHVISVYDYGEQSNLAWFAMERMEGGSLAKLLREKGPLPEDQAFAICRDVLKGLQAIHDQGLMHGDVKPDNVLGSSGHEVWKIADLGIARYLSPLSGMALGVAASGTIRYLAPECWGRFRPEGTQPPQYLPQSDFYAVGAMLFEMVSGSKPFADVNIEDICRAHQERVLADGPADVTLPKKVRAVIERATAHDPGNRYLDANAFLKALVKVEPEKSSRRWPVAACLGAIVLGVAALGALFSFWKPASPPTFEGQKFNVFVAERLGKPFPPDRMPSLVDSETLPLRKGDKVYVTAELRQAPAASSFLISISSDGKAKPFHSDDWTWTMPQPQGGEWHRIRWPTIGKEPAALPDSPSGLEAILWFVRDRELTPQERAQLDKLLENLVWRQHPLQWTLERAIWWNNGPRELQRGLPDEKDVRDADDPINQTEKLLLEIKKCGLAQYGRAVCYPFVRE